MNAILRSHRALRLLSYLDAHPTLCACVPASVGLLLGAGIVAALRWVSA